MSFNLDRNKQTQKAIKNKTKQNKYHLALAFNNNNKSENNS